MTPYFEHAGIVIYHGDAREVLPTLEAVDVVLTDPPYSTHVHEKSRRGAAKSVNGSALATRRAEAGDYARYRDLGFDSLAPSLAFSCGREFARLARRWVIVFTDAENQRLWQRACERGGLDHVRVGYWHKLGGTPQFTGDRPGTACEELEIAHRPGRKHWNGGGKAALWAVAVERNDRTHPTQKPIALMNALVSDFTDEGELVLDPFMGAGTTLVAAKRNGRRAIGIEIDERYCEIAARRVMQTLEQPALPLAMADR